MVIVLKRAILRLLEQRGYVLIKKAEYDTTAIAPRSQTERAFYFKRVVELEKHNRQLTEAATESAKRVVEIQEHNRQLTEAATESAKRVVEIQEHNRQLTEAATESAKRVVELEEHNRQLTESATKHALRVQKLERAIGAWLPEFEGDDGTVEYARVAG